MNVSAKRIELLCDECYTDGVNKELFVRMTKFFTDNALTPLEIPDEIRQHIDFLAEREGMIMGATRDYRPLWTHTAEKKMIAEMKQEYLMEDCPSWRRLEIQQDLSVRDDE